MIQIDFEKTRTEYRKQLDSFIESFIMTCSSFEERQNRLEQEATERMEKVIAADRYDEKSFWKKLREKACDMGLALVYKALQLYYAMIDRDTPLQAKLVIAGALAYLVCPVDLIPDILPVGYADDMSAILAAYKMAEAYVTPKIKARARKKITDLFGVEVFDEVCEEETKTKN